MYRNRKKRALNLTVLKRGRKLRVEGYRTSEELDRDSHESELVSSWISGHPNSVLTKFCYSVRKEGSETEDNPEGDYYTMSDTKPVYAYTIDTPKVTDISEINTKAVYNKHKNHFPKPCCQTRLDMIELGLIPE